MGVLVKTILYQLKSSKVKKGKEVNFGWEISFSLLVFTLLTDLKFPTAMHPVRVSFALICFLVRWIKHRPDVLLCVLRSNG